MESSGKPRLRLCTFQTEQEEGIISFQEASAFQPAVGHEGAGSIAWTSIVNAAVGHGDFGAHLPGIIPVELSAWGRGDMRLLETSERNAAKVTHTHASAGLLLPSEDIFLGSVVTIRCMFICCLMSDCWSSKARVP